MANTVLGTHGSGIHASRPAGNAVPDGSLYSCSTHSLIYVSSYGGNSWATWASLTGTGFADPMTTRGDIIVRDSSNTTARLAVGATGKVLKSDGTDISWGYRPLIGCQAVASSTTTLGTSGTDGAVVFDGADNWDSHAFHDPVTNNTRITIPSGLGGKYDLKAYLPFTANSTGRRTITFRKNGTTTIAIDRRPADSAGGSTLCTGSVEADLAAADYVEVLANQTSGGSLTVAVGSLFSVALVGV